MYLLKRNSTYYFRLRIPSDLIQHFNGKTHIVKSLKTKDLSAAKIFASHLNAQTQQSFALLRVQGFELIKPLTTRENQKPSIKLSKLIDLYLNEKSPGWAMKTTEDFTRLLSVSLKLFGDKPVDKISRESCIKFRDTLSKLPKHFAKKKEYRGKSYQELMELDRPKLSDKTVNMYMVLVSSVFKWGTKHGHMQSNPAEGLLITKKTKVSEERKAYTKEDIKLLFDALPYSAEAPEMYWIPRIARFSGMRLEEIAQLYVEDIKTVDGIPCFDINDRGDKKLKACP